MKYVICTLLLTVSVAACAQPPLMPATTDPCAPVVVPSLPRELNFAGEPVPLGNYDTRESLLREVLPKADWIRMSVPEPGPPDCGN